GFKKDGFKKDKPTHKTHQAKKSDSHKKPYDKPYDKPYGKTHDRADNRFANQEHDKSTSNTKPIRYEKINGVMTAVSVDDDNGTNDTPKPKKYQVKKRES
ncbi:MAG: hypothetical protein Q4G13_08705, partial [Moraxella sp.]|nr:hypothetical protein [Moraxella sp.]